MKEKIRNGDFTPDITNTWTHWTAEVNVKGQKKRFRSSWEACFYLCHSHLKYEVLRIPYAINGVLKTYVADFYDDVNRILYEVKSISQFKKQIHKIDAAIKYCMDNNIRFIWVNEKNIMNYTDEKRFTGENLKQYKMLLKGLKSYETH